MFDRANPRDKLKKGWNRGEVEQSQLDKNDLLDTETSSENPDNKNHADKDKPIKTTENKREIYIPKAHNILAEDKTAHLDVSIDNSTWAGKYSAN